MKKIFLLPLLLLVLLNNSNVLAQSCFTVNSPVLSCTVPCATLTVVPSIPTLAATTSYAVSSVTYTPYSYTAGTAAIGVGQDDIWSPIVNLPFYFCFFGNSYDKIVIGANGQISFNTSLANGFNDWTMNNNNGLPNSPATNSSVRNCIMAPYYDIDPALGGTIHYQTIGLAPCRVFVVSWNNCPLYSCTGKIATQQIVLYESTNTIDINIANKQSCAGWNYGAAITGINNSTGSLFYTAPGENGPQFNATNQSWRFTPTGAVSPWTYSWSGPGGPIAGSSATVVVCPATTSVYTVTATTVACVNLSVTLTATVTASNFISPISGPLAICAGSTAAFSDATAGGTWSSSTPGVATIGTTSGIVTGISGGVTTLTYAQGGCNQVFTLTVIQPGPITGPSTVCAGGSIALTDNPAGGTWSSLNVGVATIGLTSGVVTGVAVGNTIITYTVGPGCTATTPLNVYVLSPITGNTTVCQGSNTTLNNVAAGGTWASNNTGVATVDLNTGVVSGLSQGNAIITYAVGGGCYTTTTVTVNPDLPISGPASECQRRTSITLSDPVGGGTWSSSNPSVATVSTTTGEVFGVTPGSGGTAIITYTNMYGCVITTPVTINPTPTAPGVTPFTVCQFLPMGPLGPPAAPSGSAYIWYGPGVTAGSITPPVPQTAVPGTDSFYVTFTSPFGCISDSSLMMVHVTAKPDTPTTISTQYCQYYQTPAALGSQVSNYTGTLKWYSGGILLGTVAPVPQDSTFTYPYYEVAYVTQTVNGCQSDSAMVPVRIIPSPQFTITHPDWVCQDDSINLSYTGLPGSPLIDSTYMWTIPPGAFFVNGTVATDSFVMIQFDSATTNNYVTLTVSNLQGQCATTTSIRQNVIALPTADATSKADVCLSDTVSIALGSSSASAIDFAWYVDTTPLFSSTALTILSANSNSGGPFTIRWDDTGTHIIHVQAFAVHGCADKATADTVNVHPLPDASFKVLPADSGPLCLEDSVLFTANNDNYADNYYWTPEHSFNNADKHTIWGRVETEQSIITLTVTDPFGCVATSSTELDPSVCCNVPFPSAFTPNGDTHNDVFRPVPQVHEYHTYHVFRILNRWGQTVFETTNNKAEWDGTFDGVPCDLGVYYYYLKYDCNGKTIEQKGDVTLIR